MPGEVNCAHPLVSQNNQQHSIRTIRIPQENFEVKFILCTICNNFFLFKITYRGVVHLQANVGSVAICDSCFENNPDLAS